MNKDLEKTLKVIDVFALALEGLRFAAGHKIMTTSIMDDGRSIDKWVDDAWKSLDSIREEPFYKEFFCKKSIILGEMKNDSDR